MPIATIRWYDWNTNCTGGLSWGAKASNPVMGALVSPCSIQLSIPGTANP